MVQTLYRGKSKTDGVWVYGTLMYAANAYWIVDKDAYFDYGELMDYEEVIPETIGRNVSRACYNCDKPEQELYQGDIVEVRRSKDKDPNHSYIAIVVDEHCITQNGLGRCFTQDTVEVTVIGNVFDNPELVGEKHAELYKHYHGFRVEED